MAWPRRIDSYGKTSGGCLGDTSKGKVAESQQRIELIEWSGDNLSFDPKWADEEPDCKKGLLCEVLAVTFSGEVEGLKARQASPKTGQ